MALMRRIAAFFLCLLCAASAAQGADGTLGTVEDLLTAVNEPKATMAESTLGLAVADAARTVCGSDTALIPGGDLAANLRGGAVRERDLERALPSDSPLVRWRVTEELLRELLERCVSSLTVDEREQLSPESESPWFPQVSGIRLRCDATALVGERVRELDVEGVEGASFTLAGPAHLEELMPELAAVREEVTGYTGRSAFAAYLRELEALAVPRTGRVRVIGVRQEGLIGGIPPMAVLALFLVLVAFSAVNVRYHGRPKSRRYGTR